MSQCFRVKRQKGCSMCKPHKFLDAPQAQRKSWQELKFIGKTSRVTRHDLGDQ